MENQRRTSTSIRKFMAIGLFLAFFLTLFVQVPTASAIPSYARQTGFPCKSCHMTPPELTALGRAFKLNGYTMAGQPTVTSKPTGSQGGLNLLQNLPLSVLFDTAFTSLRSPQVVPDPNNPGSTLPSQNGSFQFPEDASLFLAGAWSTHVGSFVQVTYDAQSDHFSWDNSDIRYANSTKIFGKDMTYGITLNNNPGVQDLWNSTPAWGFPWVGSNWAPTPGAGTIVDGGLAQDVAGIGGYVMLANHLYVEGTAYRSMHIGAAQPYNGTEGFTLRGVAPYWRVAWQQTTKNNYLEVGTYGIFAKTTPNSVVGPLIDSYTDWAVDFQDDLTIPRLHNDVISFRGTYIRENSTMDATSNFNDGSLVPHHLNTVKLNAEYHFGDRVSTTFGWFNTDGTIDPVVYASFNPVTGDVNGDPRNAGYIANVSWWPVQNISLTFQYTGYTRFNGAATNYDGNFRNANQNNTVYLLARFVF